MSGKAIIFSAPSGSGKTTLVKYLLQHNPDLEFSISATTRPSRGSEVHGKDYYFLSTDEFRKKINNEEFIEWEEVYPDIFYGTLKLEIQRIWDAGKSVVFDVDVKGGINLKSYFGDKGLSIFVKVPSLSHLEKRLRERATDSPESLARRLAKAEHEMSFQDQFDEVLINDNLGDAQQKAQGLYEKFISH